MIRTRTILAGVFFVLLFLFPASFQVARAQEMPCNNSQAEPLIPTNAKGQPLMPEEIQDNAKIMKKLKDDRLTEGNLRRCLENNKPLKNHVIDFDRYVAAWKEIKDPKPALRIQDSVLWSFKEEGRVSLAEFAIDIEEADGTVTHVVTGKIRWKNVTMGPFLSAMEIKFPQRTSFKWSRFPDMADFSNTTFGDRASFSDATFGDDTSFSEATFGDTTFFDKATFGHDASFSRARFGSGASFFETTFGDDASFSGTTFGDYASFFETTFGHDTDFLRATFGGDISLQGATFRGKLNLHGTNWEGRADLRETEIEDLCWNSKDYPSSVKGVFDARGAKFKKIAIKDVHFSDLVDFSDVEFGRSGEISSDKDKSKTDSCGRKAGEPSPEPFEQKTEEFIFQNLIFEKEVDFLRATFQNDAIFVRNRFHSVWDLTGVKFQRKEGKEEQQNPLLCLSFNRINKLFMEREHLGYASSWSEHFVPNLLPLTALGKSRIRGVIDDGSYSCSDFLDKSRGESKSGKKNEDLREIYKTIESSFRLTNDRLAENEAWYLSMVVYEESQYSKVKDWDFFIAVEYWVLLIFGNFPSRYGIDLYRVVLVSVGLILFFAIIYRCYFYLQYRVNKWRPYVKLKPFPDQKRAFRFRPFERFFQSWERQERPLHPWKDALFLSGRAFFKLGLGTAYPRTRKLVWIASVEWIVGMYMLIHFLIAVKNTLPIAVPFLAVAG